jgi:hypothetical protein
MCSAIEICYPKYNLGVRFSGYSSLSFLMFDLQVQFLCQTPSIPLYRVRALLN